MLEAICGLAADRRALFTRQEVAEQEVVEHVLELLGVVLRREVIDRAGPEGPPDHGAPLQHDLRACGQPVDARANHRL